MATAIPTSQDNNMFSQPPGSKGRPAGLAAIEVLAYHQHAMAMMAQGGSAGHCTADAQRGAVTTPRPDCYIIHLFSA